jgi:hypothetical protein
MRFDPDARRKAVSMPPRDTQALYHQHVAGRSELDQLGFKSKPEAAPSTLGLTHEASVKLTIHSERNPPCHKCNECPRVAGLELGEM